MGKPRDWSATTFSLKSFTTFAQRPGSDPWNTEPQRSLLHSIAVRRYRRPISWALFKLWRKPRSNFPIDGWNSAEIAGRAATSPLPTFSSPPSVPSLPFPEPFDRKKNHSESGLGGEMQPAIGIGVNSLRGTLSAVLGVERGVLSGLFHIKVTKQIPRGHECLETCKTIEQVDKSDKGKCREEIDQKNRWVPVLVESSVQ